MYWVSALMDTGHERVKRRKYYTPSFKFAVFLVRKQASFMYCSEEQWRRTRRCSSRWTVRWPCRGRRAPGRWWDCASRRYGLEGAEMRHRPHKALKGIFDLPGMLSVIILLTQKSWNYKKMSHIFWVSALTDAGHEWLFSPPFTISKVAMLNK